MTLHMALFYFPLSTGSQVNASVVDIGYPNPFIGYKYTSAKACPKSLNSNSGLFTLETPGISQGWITTCIRLGLGINVYKNL